MAKEQVPQEFEPGMGIEQLPGYLGFIETEELAAARPLVIEAMESGDQERVRDTLGRYQELGEAVIEQKSSKQFQKAQVGMILQTALMRRDGGRTGGYLQDLRHVLDNINYDQGIEYGEISSPLVEGMLMALAEYLGYADTPEIKDLKKRFLEALQTGDEEGAHQLHIEYSVKVHDLFEITFHDDDVETRLKRGMGQGLSEALIMRIADHHDEYKENLEFAYNTASSSAVQQDIIPVLATLLEETGVEVPYGTAFNEGWKEFFNRPEYEENRNQFYQLKDATRSYLPDEEWVRDTRELSRRWVKAIEKAAILGTDPDTRQEFDQLELVELATIIVHQTVVEEGVWEEEGVSFPIFDMIGGDPADRSEPEGDVESGEVIDLREL
jgi:hypothetical protein